MSCTRLKTFSLQQKFAMAQALVLDSPTLQWCWSSGHSCTLGYHQPKLSTSMQMSFAFLSHFLHFFFVCVLACYLQHGFRTCDSGVPFSLQACSKLLPGFAEAPSKPLGPGHSRNPPMACGWEILQKPSLPLEQRYSSEWCSSS